jgi:hypothetical protein
LCAALLALASVVGCSDDDGPELEFLAVTFNSGTTTGLAHNSEPDDGYTSDHATISDMWYGDGLAWLPAVDAARAFLAELQPDVIVFQEIFYAGECETIPPENYPDFFCQDWTAGDPTVAQVILGAGYQVACNLGKTDKCAAVKTSFGSFRGCSGDLCLDGLDGSQVDGCGSGSRIGRGVIDLAIGGSVTLVNVHGSSGFSQDDQDCRVKQFDQVFVDLGDGAPGANGAINLVMGDFNTDPGRLARDDDSAARLIEVVGDGLPFQFVTEVGLDAEPTYTGLFNIDHVISDALSGDCWAAGVTENHPAVIDAIYFDHAPIVCNVGGPLPAIN